jgi:hypothetical protein
MPHSALLSNYAQWVTGCGAFSLATWSHVSLTYAPDTSTFAVYLNGALVASKKDAVFLIGVYDQFRSEYTRAHEERASKSRVWCACRAV